MISAMGNPRRHVVGICLVSAMLGLAGCASTGGGYSADRGYGSSVCRSCGTVDSVREVYADAGNDHSAVIGTVIGAVVGGALGNQVGKGDGRKAATVGGAVAGGVIGHQVGERQSSGNAWQVRVRLDDGRYATVTQRQRPDVRVGDYVEVRNDRVYRR